MTEDTKELICPECQAVLPEEREKSPWCECGWSSVKEDWILEKLPPTVGRMLASSNKYAQKLAASDERTANFISQPLGRWIWKLYLGITMLLCIPVLVGKAIILMALLVGWGYALYLESVTFIFLVSLITIAYVGVWWVTRAKKTNTGIEQSRQTAVEFFRVIDNVAKNLQTECVDKVIIQLGANVGIRQKYVWGWKPHFEKELMIGLFSLNVLTISQLNAVLAHEYGHLRQKDTFTLIFINNTITSLYSLTADTWSLYRKLLEMGNVAGFAVYLLHLILNLYFHLLVWVSKWAMRRQEYTADLIAAKVYGKSVLLEALIALGAIDIGFNDYLPIIWQNIQNEFDRRDFYNQFVDIWGKMMVITRQGYYAKALASFQSVYDTHPSYKARRRVLTQINDRPSVEMNNQPSLSLLPSAPQLGRELTVQILQNRAHG